MTVLRLDIPGFAALSLEHLVLDFNGTLALNLLGHPQRLVASLRG